MMIVTHWMHPPTKPEVPGVYERRFDVGICYSYWDGKKWFFAAHSPDEAVEKVIDGKVSPSQELAWRGITKEEYLIRLGALNVKDDCGK